MTIFYFRGDIFLVKNPRAIAHGCNCAGAMGKGIAKTFREKWPAMYLEYKNRCSAGKFLLGDIFEWNDGQTTIFNLGTQKSWRSKAEILAIKVSLEKLRSILEISGLSRVYMPRIGAGLGGLAWPEVQSVVESIFRENSIEVFICDEFVEGAYPEIK